jgi:hypothetical protein
MTELVRKRAMLAAKWEMLYVFVLFAIWLGGGIYTVLDPSPFTDPSLPGENIDRCIDADGMPLLLLSHSALNVSRTGRDVVWNLRSDDTNVLHHFSDL